MSKRHKNKGTRDNSAIFVVQDQHARNEAVVLTPPRSVGNPIGEKQPNSNVTPIRMASPQAVGRLPPLANAETMIRRRAYELYEKRGRQDGHAEEDWLRAEAEILGTVFSRAQSG